MIERFRRAAQLASLVVACETINLLPYQTVWTFRPIFMEVFGLSNQQLGHVQALFGFVSIAVFMCVARVHHHHLAIHRHHHRDHPMPLIAGLVATLQTVFLLVA